MGQSVERLTKDQDVIIQLEAELIHSSISREAGHQLLLLRVNLTAYSLKILSLQCTCPQHQNKTDKERDNFLFTTQKDLLLQICQHCC